MSRYTAQVITLVGTVYLVLGLAASVFPAMFLLYAPQSALTSGNSLIYFGYKIVTIGPCYFIAYALIRQRNWGRYLLISYNALWLVYITFALVRTTEPQGVDTPVLVVALIAYIILGGLIALMFQRDVRATMSQ